MQNDTVSLSDKVGDVSIFCSFNKLYAADPMGAWMHFE